MFGLTAFAQSAFVALGGNVYVKDITEPVSATYSTAGSVSIPVAIF